MEKGQALEMRGKPEWSMQGGCNEESLNVSVQGPCNEGNPEWSMQGGCNGRKA